MSDPAATIREALLSDTNTTTADVSGALAALTELEQQLAAQQIAWHKLWERAEAAEADRDRLQAKLTDESGYCGEVLIERDRYREALEQIADGTTPDRIGIYAALRDWVNKTARAALDRHTTP